eukprot:227153-Chlamydomonas_euryale.AAC.1
MLPPRAAVGGSHHVHTPHHPQVDCCLTTGELHQLMVDAGVPHLPHQALPAAGVSASPSTLSEMLAPPGLPSSCGGGRGDDACAMDVDGVAADAGAHSGGGDPGWVRGAAAVSASAHVAGSFARPGDIAAQTAGARVLVAGAVAQPSKAVLQQGTEAAVLQPEVDAAALRRGDAAATTAPPWPSGSGGYAEFVARAAARDAFGVELPPGPLPLRTLRNADLREATVAHPVTGAPLLRVALAYGFRNIQ